MSDQAPRLLQEILNRRRMRLSLLRRPRQAALGTVALSAGVESPYELAGRGVAYDGPAN